MSGATNPSNNAAAAAAAVGSPASSRPVVSITRKAAVSCAHRLHSTRLSDEENAAVFGKCNWPGGHGHNYVVLVTVRGPVDPATGMVMNLTDLARIMDECVTKPLDHRNIDRDVPDFCADGRALGTTDDHPRVSTAENLAVWIWEQVERHAQMPRGLLYEVRLEETEKNSVVYRGEHLPGAGEVSVVESRRVELRAEDTANEVEQASQEEQEDRGGNEEEEGGKKEEKTADPALVQECVEELFGTFDRDGDGVLLGDELRHLIAFNGSESFEDITAFKVSNFRKFFPISAEGDLLGESDLTIEAFSKNPDVLKLLGSPRRDEAMAALHKYAREQGWSTMIKSAKKS